MREVLSKLFLLRGVHRFIRSDNGLELVAGHVRRWIATVGATTAYIELGSPWENGYVKSFNAGFRDELLDREIFTSLREAQMLIKAWRSLQLGETLQRPGPPAADAGTHRSAKPGIRSASARVLRCNPALQPGAGSSSIRSRSATVTKEFRGTSDQSSALLDFIRGNSSLVRFLAGYRVNAKKLSIRYRLP